MHFANRQNGCEYGKIVSDKGEISNISVAINLCNCVHTVNGIQEVVKNWYKSVVKMHTQYVHFKGGKWYTKMVENMFTLIAQYIRRMAVLTNIIYITIKEKQKPNDDIAFKSYRVDNEKIGNIIDNIYQVLSSSLSNFDEFDEFEFYYYNDNIYIHITKF